jgi:hypothetical protein
LFPLAWLHFKGRLSRKATDHLFVADQIDITTKRPAQPAIITQR